MCIAVLSRVVGIYKLKDVVRFIHKTTSSFRHHEGARMVRTAPVCSVLPGLYVDHVIQDYDSEYCGQYYSLFFTIYNLGVEG